MMEAPDIFLWDFEIRYKECKKFERLYLLNFMFFRDRIGSFFVANIVRDEGASNEIKNKHQNLKEQ